MNQSIYHPTIFGVPQQKQVMVSFKKHNVTMWYSSAEISDVVFLSGFYELETYKIYLKPGIKISHAI